MLAPKVTSIDTFGFLDTVSILKSPVKLLSQVLVRSTKPDFI